MVPIGTPLIASSMLSDRHYACRGQEVQRARTLPRRRGRSRGVAIRQLDACKAWRSIFPLTFNGRAACVLRVPWRRGGGGGARAGVRLGGGRAAPQRARPRAVGAGCARLAPPLPGPARVPPPPPPGWGERRVPIGRPLREAPVTC